MQNLSTFKHGPEISIFYGKRDTLSDFVSHNEIPNYERWQNKRKLY